MNWIRFTVLVIVIGLSPITSAQNTSSIRWFDADGVFHVGDPGPHIDRILSGEIRELVVPGIVSEMGMAAGPVPPERLEELSILLHDRPTSFSLYIPGSKNLKKLAKKTKQLFKSGQKAPGRGSVVFQGLGVQKQGPTQMLKGSEINSVILIPLDPKIVVQIPGSSSDAVKTVESLIRTAAKKSWRRFGVEKTFDLRGRAEIDNLVPGPWLAWINQMNMLTHLVRVPVTAGQKTEVLLDAPYARCFISPEDGG
ncbi:hypothetical protein JXA40_03430 [bacterium]|nr:hypothetical protein [candidate division CSSED10-310 bacterium]